MTFTNIVIDFPDRLLVVKFLFNQLLWKLSSTPACSRSEQISGSHWQKKKSRIGRCHKKRDIAGTLFLEFLSKFLQIIQALSWNEKKILEWPHAIWYLQDICGHFYRRVSVNLDVRLPAEIPAFDTDAVEDSVKPWTFHNKRGRKLFFIECRGFVWVKNSVQMAS